MKVSLYTPCPVEFEDDYFTWGNLTYNINNKQIETIYGTKPEEV